MINIIPSDSVTVTPSDTNYITANRRVLVVEPNYTATDYDHTTDTITITDNPYSNGDSVVVVDPAGTDLSVNQVLYVINVSSDDFNLSEDGITTYTIGGLDTDLVTLNRIETIENVRVTGTLYVGVPGTVVYLPVDALDTNDPSLVSGGAQAASNVYGDFPIAVKKVFSTGTTASGIKLKFS